ncbi:hypothetical protein HAX54_026600 [Datura stramonium]|uniref:At1g61900-like C-terminal domain-containing protein n=1 Tax=Datura stramonium TaxID=4076 RepID=A0ABS8V184_DATST|nr:hypothetical protein [Datura stramonium]
MWVASERPGNPELQREASCKMVGEACTRRRARQTDCFDACPLDFKQPSEVINACRNLASPSPSCCSSLNAYITGIQKQMLITNRQAIIYAAIFGSMLLKAGVMANVYELCDVDLKDFSLQAKKEKRPMRCDPCFQRGYLQDKTFLPICPSRGGQSYLVPVAGGSENVLAILDEVVQINEAGCSLRSLPADLVYDNSTGFSFTCDLNDNIAAPWPSSSW